MAYRVRKGAVITDGDSINHLSYVKEYYRTGGKPIDLSNIYILDGPDYPNGFHKLFYLLKVPIWWLERYGGYLPSVFDCAHLTLAFFAIFFVGGEHFEWLLLFPFLRIFWGNEGRASHFSERAYGVLWGNIYLLAVTGLYITSNGWWLILAIAAFCIASVSSKFTWQATAFFSLMFSVVYATPVFLACFLFSAICSIIFTRGYSFRVLKGVIRHSLFYRDHFSPRNPSLRNNYKELFKISSGFNKYVYSVFTNSPLRVFTDFPISIVIIFSIALGRDIDFWGAWVLLGIGLVWLIATKPLKFLGEPERYLEFCVIPAFVFLSTVGFWDYPIATIFCIVLITAVIAFQNIFRILMHRPDVKNKIQMDMVLLRSFFSDIENKKILTIPFRLSFFLGYENRKNTFLTIFVNVGWGENQEAYRWLMKDRYPFVRSDLGEVIARYDLDYIVVHKPSVDFMNKTYEGGYYNFDPYKTVYENDTYAVYGVKV